ncbi:hypothetical protein LFT45_18525 [Arthrobacter sp. FW305-BF8]|uniref:hypothetical protein n=1 Tax=Arthrobacter sp. FW305-BF8 TaxID=2879617 RepID=UPI001F36E6AC|nr:hypothetical protein [Arthrobacter sp. FW305-BF8]UKA53686.1 hypothetical protein LFT45_18525 [Arthrobacter sp. FW305-BF8]
MPDRSPLISSALGGAAASAVILLATVACSPVVSIENADVPQWRATALPSDGEAVLEDSGKILNRDRIIQTAASVPAGEYTLTITCDGGGKAFFAVTLAGKELAEAGAACNGSRETADIRVPKAGRMEISASSVDAPLLYAYHLVPAR